MRERAASGVPLRLLDAAAALLEEGGVEALSLREIARRAEVSHAAPYKHFESKEALLRVLCGDGFAQLDAAMADAGAVAAPEPLDQLIAIGTGYVLFALRHRALYELMTRLPMTEESKPAAMLEEDSGAWQRLWSSVRNVREDRGLDVCDDVVSQDCVLLWSVVHGLASLAGDGRLPGMTADEPHLFRAIIARVVDIYPQRREA